MEDSATDLLLSHQQITLECRNLSYKPKCRTIKEDILKDVHGKFLSGRLTAILGPSGAGKTSLLNVLSAFKENGSRGSILVNGVERKTCEFRKISSYIPQEFAMLDKLTVLETLQVSADLKLGLKIHKSTKQKVLDQIITLLNLEKSANTLVERLSGGEKKRLSIGVELVTNPPVMLFDEPTSGLDSVSSLQVLNHLQKLAHSGRTVICVVHQPSSRLLKLFDDILVLSSGECIYNGPQQDMVKYFQNDGFTCPNYYNPADYVVEVASKEHGSDLTSLIRSNKQNFIDSPYRQIEVKVEENSVILNGFHKSKHMKHYEANDSYIKARPANFHEQFIIITKRSMQAMVRETLTVRIRVAAHILVAFLLGAVFWDVGNDAAKILSNVSCLFFVILFIFFGNSMPVILTCPLETKVFIREHLNNWYSVTAYYLAKLVADFPLQFICPTVFIFIAYFLTGQPNELHRFVMFWAICILTGAVGQSVGLLLGCTFGMDLSVFLVPISSVPVMIFSGFFIRFHELPEYLQPLTYVSYLRYSFEGLVQVIYGFDRESLKCNAIFCYYRSTTKFMEDMGMFGNRYECDIFALIAWIAVLQVLLYASLVLQVRWRLH